MRPRCRALVIVFAMAALAGCAGTTDRAAPTPAVTLDAPIQHSDPEVRAYFEEVRRAIRRGWTYPCLAAAGAGTCTYPEGKVVVEFGIAWGGALVFTEIKTPSGYPELDTAATVAVKRAAPFPPVPSALKRPGNGIPIRVSMIYRAERQDPAATR